MESYQVGPCIKGDKCNKPQCQLQHPKDGLSGAFDNNQPQNKNLIVIDVQLFEKEFETITNEIYQYNADFKQEFEDRLNKMTSFHKKKNDDLS